MRLHLRSFPTSPVTARSRSIGAMCHLSIALMAIESSMISRAKPSRLLISTVVHPLIVLRMTIRIAVKMTLSVVGVKRTASASPGNHSPFVLLRLRQLLARELCEQGMRFFCWVQLIPPEILITVFAERAFAHVWRDTRVCDIGKSKFLRCR